MGRFSDTSFLHEAASQHEKQEEKRKEYQKVCEEIFEKFKDDPENMWLKSMAKLALKNGTYTAYRSDLNEMVAGTTGIEIEAVKETRLKILNLLQKFDDLDDFEEDEEEDDDDD